MLIKLCSCIIVTLITKRFKFMTQVVGLSATFFHSPPYSEPDTNHAPALPPTNKSPGKHAKTTKPPPCEYLPAHKPLERLELTIITRRMYHSNCLSHDARYGGCIRLRISVSANIRRHLIPNASGRNFRHEQKHFASTCRKQCKHLGYINKIAIHLTGSLIAISRSFLRETIRLRPKYVNLTHEY